MTKLQYSVACSVKCEDCRILRDNDKDSEQNGKYLLWQRCTNTQAYWKRVPILSDNYDLPLRSTNVLSAVCSYHSKAEKHGSQQLSDKVPTANKFPATKA
jgi:hypothetical protein